jgi:hypothetical protein
MPGTDIEMAYQDRYTLAPPSRRGSTTVQWYILPPLFIPSLVNPVFVPSFEFGWQIRWQIIRRITRWN